LSRATARNHAGKIGERVEHRADEHEQDIGCARHRVEGIYPLQADREHAEEKKPARGGGHHDRSRQWQPIPADADIQRHDAEKDREQRADHTQQDAETDLADQELLAKSASSGRVVGVDYSKEMVEQTTVRNAKAIEAGRVDLREGSVERLPFEDDTFTNALAVNSMQVWPDAVSGLREIYAL
jgi:hypothetical protein